MYILHSIQETISDKTINCDAVGFLFAYMRVVDEKQKSKHLVPLFNFRNTRILPNQKHLYIEVLDNETGELLTMNATHSAHYYCLNNRIYPKDILSLF